MFCRRYSLQCNGNILIIFYINDTEMLRVCIGEILKPLVNVPISRTSSCSCMPGIRNQLASKALHLQRQKYCKSVPESTSSVRARDPDLIECSDSAWEDSQSLAVIPAFVSAEEEQLLLQDISRSLRGKRYEFQHWDGAIEGYRETEKSHWSAEAAPVISRLRAAAAGAVEGRKLSPLPEVHVLELAKDGYIRPHIDSVKFCGEVIAGVSLLSPSVMRLEHRRDPGEGGGENEEEEDRWICALLPPLSLYILQGVVRYRYAHAILSDEHSHFRGQAIPRERRISVICRTLPD